MSWTLFFKMINPRILSTEAKGNENFYYNIGDKPIFIITRFRTDPCGDPGIQEYHYRVAPGEGIDLTVVGFSRVKKLEKNIHDPRT